VDALLETFPPDAVKIALVLLLGLFVGLEREEHKQRDAEWAFGGVRTFPLIGLIGYALALLAGGDVVLIAIGLVVIGAFMALSFHHKLKTAAEPGVTTEMTGLATYLIGALVQRDQFWIAATIAVLGVLLLELKRGLEGLTRRFAPDEIVTLAKFLLLTVVILPVLPHGHLTRFDLDPFAIWVVVVAVSAVSYGTYLIQRLIKGRGGVLLSALLGGAYSSTMTTVALARKARSAARPDLFAGSIVVASAIMYARLILLLALFNGELARTLAPWFGGLAAVGLGAGLLVARRHDAGEGRPEGEPAVHNPLELRTAIVFALVFTAVLVATQLAREYVGDAGLYGLAAIMGVVDVDPFLVGLAEVAGGTTSLTVAAGAIVIVAVSNNVAKAIYALVFADRKTGRRALVLMLGLAALGLIPLLGV
jgi:uncharacterized membrane protein (DUF4010 family)